MPWLLQHDPVFQAADAGEGLRLWGNDAAECTGAMLTVTEELARTGRTAAPRRELYPVVQDFAEEPLLFVDRAAVSWFGMRPFGVHLNGFVRRETGIWLWVAQRAADKITFPGRWDNLVAGGQPAHLSLRQNLVKECAEEAGMPADLAGKAQQCSTITYVMEDEHGLKPDTLFCFDLELPRDFVPRPTDGEVERFFLLPATEVAAVVRDTTRFKPNCNLVVIDFLLRHGLLDGELPAAERAALAQALRAPLP